MFSANIHLDRVWDSKRGMYVYSYDIKKDKEMQAEIAEFLEGWSNDSLEIVDSETDEDGYSVCVRENVSGELFWFDLWWGSEDSDGYRELNGDWNEYIFSTTDSRDMARKAVMEDSDFFASVFEIAENYVRYELSA